MVGSKEGECGTESDVDSLFEDSSDIGSVAAQLVAQLLFW
jgi:hypothetical protein